MATKVELKDFENRMGIAFGRTQGQMMEMEDRLNTRIGSISSLVKGSVDSFADKIERYARESVTMPNALDEHGKALRDHEARISTLESHGAPPPAPPP